MLILRSISSRAFGHIGQQLGAILNGPLQHINFLPLEIEREMLIRRSIFWRHFRDTVYVYCVRTAQ